MKEFSVISIIVLFGIALLLYMLFTAFANRVLKHTFTFKNYPLAAAPLRIFFISDVHRRKIHQRLLEQVYGKADIVVIGGDLLERGVPLKRVRENLLKLNKIGPIYFVWGNNDREIDDQQVEEMLLSYGVTILHNTAVNIQSEHDIFLLGVDDLITGMPRLDLALKSAPPNSFRLLVSHHPSVVKYVTPNDHITFVMSGHTHGGQIRFFGFGPYQKGKIHYLNATTLLISNGYGTTLLPLRLGAKPETHLITIKGSNS